MKKCVSLALSLVMTLLLLPWQPSVKAAPKDTLVWDMENLPGTDLYSAGWITADYENVDSGGQILTPSQDVLFQKAAGKGVGGSTALEIYQRNYGDWSDIFTVTLSKDQTACTDWSGAKMLWFWVSNTSTKDVRFELLINGKMPSANWHYYSYVNGRLTDLGNMPEAWTDAGYARIRVASGFAGYLGVPLCAYGNVAQVSTFRIYAADLPRYQRMYLDDFWITESFLFDTANGGNVLDSSTILNPADISGAASVTMDAGMEYQQVKAFGASDAWWATGIGDTGTASAALKLLYTDLGISLNNYRINVGGGVLEDDSDTVGGWRGPESPLGEDGTMDITRNKKSWAALQELDSLGTVSNYTLFMNTPPSTMMDNGKTYQGKLPEALYDDYAQYVAEVVQLYREAGFDIAYVSPINEPTGSGWLTATGQECAVYTMEQVAEVYVRVIQALHENNVDVKLSMADYYNWSCAKDNLYTVVDTVLKDSRIRDYAGNYIDHISAHSYGTNAAQKRQMAQAVAAYNAENGTNLALHQTEWAPMVGDIADNMETATELAQVLHEDLTILNVELWSWWLGVSCYTYTDGLIYTSYEGGGDMTVTKRFWAYGNFSKFIQGCTRIQTGGMLPDGVFASAYKDEATGKLVYVLINRNDAAQAVRLAGLPAAYGQVWETSDLHNCQQIGVMNSQNAYALRPWSVTTVVFENVDYYNGRPGTVVWGMDALPQNLVSEGWAGAEYGSASDYNPENVTLTKAAGMGFAGGDAIAITQVQAGNWADIYRLQPAQKDGSYISTWKNRQILWFWADATQAHDLTVELMLDSLLPKVGYGCYTIEDGTVKTFNILRKAYSGDISYGVIPVSAGFRGWIGVPLAAYDLPEQVSSLRIYLRGCQTGDVLYLDEFAIGSDSVLPALPAENSAPFENGILAWGANDSVGQRLAYYNDSQSRQAWVFGIQGAGGGAVLWESQSYSSVQWINVPTADLTGANKLCFYLDNQSGCGIDKLGLGLRDKTGNAYQPGQSDVATKNGYRLDYSAVGWGYLADGSTEWVTGKLDSWGWIRGIDKDFKGWIYVNITGDDSYETVFASGQQPIALDLSQITGICIKAGEDKAYSAVFDSFYGCCAVPKLQGWNLSLGEDIGAKFHVSLNGASPQNAVMEFTVAGQTLSVTPAQADRAENGDYIFPVHVAAAQMTEPIGVRLKVNGKTMHEDSYTVRQYADRILAGDYDEETKALVRAMLNYGGKAQTYFGYNTDHSAGADITVTESDIPADVAKMTVSGSAEGISYYGATLVFTAKTAVRFYFTGDVSGCTFKAGDKTITPVEKNGMWYAEVADINPQDLDETVTVTVNGTLTVTYSPLNYMARMNAKGSNALKALLKAMYTYHLAAEEYTK